MKKLAILTCLKATDVCAGCSCLAAFHARQGAFSLYAGEELRLTAFLHCSRCIQDCDHPALAPGFQEKADRLVREGVEAVHVGVCGSSREGKPCPGMLQHTEELERRGLRVVWGTH